MKSFLLLIILSITACSSNNSKSNFNFSDKMSFEEFKKKLEVYSKNNPYPNIDD